MRSTCLALALIGCGGERDLEVTITDTSPDTWFACNGPLTLRIEGTVDADPGDELSAVVTLGPVGVDAGTLSVGSNGSFAVTASYANEAPCEGDCPVTLSLFGKKATGEATTSIEVVPGSVPTLITAELVSSAGGTVGLDVVTLADNPADSLSAELWTRLNILLDDRTPDVVDAVVLLCPEDVDPSAVEDISACVPSPAGADVAGVGQRGLFASTEPFAEAGCSAQAVASGVPWKLWLRIADHSCAGRVTLPLSSRALRFVTDDCDADGVLLPDDCDDLDPATYPGAEEIWYDGIDQACDGGTDDDQDGDGHAATIAGGDDCDDERANVHPGATEVCDDADNDCIPGGEKRDTVTVWAADGSDPVDVTDLAAAVAAAGDGDVLGVCPGDYAGGFTVGADIELVGDPRELPRILGGGTAPAVRVGADATVAFRHLELRDGVAAQGGGLSAPQAASVELEGCRVVDNQAGAGGGLVAGGSLTLLDTVVSDNRAQDFGGGVLMLPDGSLLLDGATEVTANTARVGGGVGLVDATAIAATTVSVHHNDATDGGGGVFGSGDVSWDGGGIEANTASRGAGMAFEQALGHGNVRVARVTLTGNTAATDGGGVLFDGVPSVAVESSLLEGNVAGERGGGIALIGCADAALAGVDVRTGTARYGGGLALQGLGANTLSTLAGSFEGNVASQDGGGLWIDDASVVRLGQGKTATAIVDNQATAGGGGIAMTRGQLELVSPDVARNSAAEGGGLRLSGVDAALLSGQLLDNAATSAGAALHVAGPSRVRLDGWLVVDSGVSTVPGIRVDAPQLVVCSSTAIADATANTVEERTIAACYDATATAFTVHTAPDCNALCN
ncbi:MAG: putative metal-binding motif-containing protein [Alphaproteobacteria bacterium]|nr:putative metal-binding motif-containing protein [Alphaproteobacteria bacterium]MCB9699056.1 putative metal-binding motif-containing protein [Alphaproteobacteria bacterium]